MKRSFKVLLAMLLAMVTIPLSNVSADSNEDVKIPIKEIFTNPDTAAFVARGIYLSQKIYNKSEDINTPVSQADLDMITEIRMENSARTKTIDPALGKLRNLKRLSITLADFDTLEGVEMFSDSLTELSLNTTLITDLTPVASLTKLTDFIVLNPSATTNNALKDNPNFLKPLELLPLNRVHTNGLKLNDNHAESLSKVTSLEMLIIVSGRIKNFEPISKLINLHTIDLTSNNLLNLTGVGNLVNLRVLRLENGDPGLDMNRFHDFSELVYPITATGNKIEDVYIGNVTSYLDISIEYITDDEGKVSPIYYYDLNQIKLPQSSEGFADFELDITYKYPVFDYVDYDNNRIMLKNDYVERKIYEHGTTTIQEFDFEIAETRLQIPGSSYIQGFLALGVNGVVEVNENPNAKKVEVEFVYNNGTDNTVTKVVENTPVDEPEEPTYEGHEFLSWYEDDTFKNEWDFETPVEEDITLHAKWEKIIPEYTVEFDSVGGSHIENVLVLENENVEMPEVPTKDGFNFKGWYTESTYENVFDFATGITEDITLYAKWEVEVILYTVTFDSKLGFTIEEIKVEANTTVERPIDPSREGYVFEGWYTDVDKDELFDFNTLINNDITLSAKWTEVENVYTVTFDSNGGSAIDEQSVIEGELVEKPVSPILDGHTFIGWFEDENFTVEYDFTTLVDQDLTLYAKWAKDDATLPDKEEPITPPETEKPVTPPAIDEETEVIVPGDKEDQDTNVDKPTDKIDEETDSVNPDNKEDLTDGDTDKGIDEDNNNNEIAKPDDQIKEALPATGVSSSSLISFALTISLVGLIAILAGRKEKEDY